MCRNGAECRYLKTGKCLYKHTAAEIAAAREGMLCITKYPAAADVATAACGGAGVPYVAPGAPHGGAWSNPRYDLGCMNCYIKQYNAALGIPLDGEPCKKTGVPGTHTYCVGAGGKINLYTTCPVPGCRGMHLKVQPEGCVLIFKQDCVYKDSCNNMKCPFWHPRDAARNKVAPPSYDGVCLFGNKCHGACAMYHMGDPVEGPSFVKVVRAYEPDGSPIEPWLLATAKRMQHNMTTGKITTEAQNADVREACELVLTTAGLSVPLPAGAGEAVAECIHVLENQPTPEEEAWLEAELQREELMQEWTQMLNAVEAEFLAHVEACADAAVCAAAEAADLPVPGTNAEMDEVEKDLAELDAELDDVAARMAEDEDAKTGI